MGVRPPVFPGPSELGIVLAGRSFSFSIVEVVEVEIELVTMFVVIHRCLYVLNIQSGEGRNVQLRHATCACQAVSNATTPPAGHLIPLTACIPLVRIPLLLCCPTIKEVRRKFIVPQYYLAVMCAHPGRLRAAMVRWRKESVHFLAETSAGTLSIAWCFFPPDPYIQQPKFFLWKPLTPLHVLVFGETPLPLEEA